MFLKFGTSNNKGADNMFRYLRALGYMVTGRFSEAWRTLQSNKYVMQATYDKSIEKTKSRRKTVEEGIAELIVIVNERTSEIKQLQGKVDLLTKSKNGAKIAMQKRIDELKSAGKTRAEIEQDGLFQDHERAHKDATGELTKATADLQSKEADRVARQKEVDNYKIELKTMQRTVRSLEDEKRTVVTDVAIAQQRIAANKVLAGAAEDETDKDLEGVREAHKRTMAQLQVSSELTANDANVADNKYLQYAEEAEADKELDDLNWGDEEANKDMTPAKLPEA
jgi:uncharacterized protein YlxW (UPF0749 family)